MCFTANREKTTALVYKDGVLDTFKLARVVNGQLRSPWRETLLGISPVGSLGSASVTLTMPVSDSIFESGDSVCVGTWHWMSKATLPNLATATNGFYLSTSKDAIIAYACECGLSKTGLVLLPVSIPSCSIEAASSDGSFILTDPYVGVNAMKGFVNELAAIGDEAFIKKYDPGFETK